MIVIGRIVLNKRNQQNSNDSSVSESAGGVGAMTKLHAEDTATTATASTIATNVVADENTSDDLDIDLTTAITISSISNRNNVRATTSTTFTAKGWCIRGFVICATSIINTYKFLSVHYQQQHLYNTYTPSSYGNLEPSSISPKANLFTSNQHAPIHENIVRTSALHNHPIQRPQQNLSMRSFIYYGIHSYSRTSDSALLSELEYAIRFSQWLKLWERDGLKNPQRMFQATFIFCLFDRKWIENSIKIMTFFIRQIYI